MKDGEAGAWRRFRVEGRVQGVGFRFWTAGEARRLGIRGFVRNCSDGSVEVGAWGRPEDLDRMEERLGRGPPGALVSAVVREEGERDDGVALQGEFEIRR